MKNISFVTNTGPNTLEYTKLLLESLKINLVGKEHEIIIFIDKDNDGTYEYLKSIKNDFYDLKIVTHKLKGPVGYQRNSNLLVDIAKHDIVSYLQSDMVIGPNYDVNILSELQDGCILSSTRIEPPLHGYSDYTITYDFGTDPTVFNMDKWNKYSEMVKTSQVAEYFFAPITFYKKVWQSIGGYDTIFRRSREDSDFVQRVMQSGIRLIQTWQANVYHFTCVSSRGKNWFDTNDEQAKKRTQLQQVADGVELRRFIRKWGSFNHGESKLNKLDMDFVVDENTNMPIDQLVHLEPYFSRMWFKTEEDKQLALKFFSNEQDPANELLGIAKKDWEASKKYYNVTDYDSIYRVGNPEDFNIKITAEFGKIPPANDIFFQYLNQISEIISSSEPGIYQLGSIKVEIKNIVNLTKDQLQVKNPPFDFSLLEIQ
jgi:GT2 family glycosyltransferase